MLIVLMNKKNDMATDVASRINGKSIKPPMCGFNNINKKDHYEIKNKAYKLYNTFPLVH